MARALEADFPQKSKRKIHTTLKPPVRSFKKLFGDNEVDP
jgi:hypothetical protein